MTSEFIGSRDWDDIKLVAFDLDGTLYRQWPLRLRMTREMLLHTVPNLNFEIIAVLRAYRRIRERLGDEEMPDFENVLIADTAAATGHLPDTVRAVVKEWIEERPLRHLARCRNLVLTELFAGLRRRGKLIGILSDYPARLKLAALGLTADFVICAGDEGIGLLKPHPRGLEVLIAAAGVQAHATVLIGDRVERDGLAARRAGTRILIRSSWPIKGFQTFSRFDDGLFAPLLEP